MRITVSQLRRIIKEEVSRVKGSRSRRRLYEGVDSNAFENYLEGWRTEWEENADSYGYSSDEVTAAVGVLGGEIATLAQDVQERLESGEFGRR